MSKCRKLDVAQVAKRLTVSTSTVYRLLDAGELKCTRLGARSGIRVFEDSVEKFEHRRSA